MEMDLTQKMLLFISGELTLGIGIIVYAIYSPNIPTLTRLLLKAAALGYVAIGGYMIFKTLSLINEIKKESKKIEGKK